MIDKLLTSESHWWVFFIGTLIFFMLTIEAGFLFGRWRRRHADPEQKSQTSTVLAALLALLGFLLAVSFGIAADRFANRKALVLEEANGIGTAFLRTDFLPEPQRSTSKQLFAEYADARLMPIETGDLDQAIRRSVDIQNKLWKQADAAAAQQPRSIPIGLYIDALNHVIDLHEERVTVGLHYRIPPSLIWTLYLVAFLAMVLMGVNFGLSNTRNLMASVALVAAFAAVLLLIVDLDQVRQRLFSVPQTPLMDARASIQESLDESPARGGGPTEESDSGPPARNSP